MPIVINPTPHLHTQRLSYASPNTLMGYAVQFAEDVLWKQPSMPPCSTSDGCAHRRVILSHGSTLHATTTKRLTTLLCMIHCLTAVLRLQRCQMTQ